MQYIASACPHCAGDFEFPEDGVGQVIPCPHCGKPITLSLPIPNKQRSRGLWILLAGLAVAVIAGLSILLVIYQKSVSATRAENARLASEIAAKENAHKEQMARMALASQAGKVENAIQQAALAVEPVRVASEDPAHAAAPAHRTQSTPFAFTIKENDNDTCLVEYVSAPGQVSSITVFIRDAPKTYYVDKVDFSRKIQYANDWQYRLDKWRWRLDNYKNTLPSGVTYREGHGMPESAMAIRNHNQEVTDHAHDTENLNTYRSNLRQEMAAARQAAPYHHPVKCFGFMSSNTVKGIPQWAVLKVLR